jgi:hypothetical protein
MGFGKALPKGKLMVSGLFEESQEVPRASAILLIQPGV